MPEAPLATVALTDLAPEWPAPPGGVPRALVQAALSLWWASLAEETWRGYSSTWRLYQRWCHAMELPALPIDPWVVALFLVAMYPTHKPQTLERHLCALSYVYKLRGGEGSLMTPTIRRILRGAKRSRGCRPEQKRALTVDLLRALTALTDECTFENERVRDRALWILMFTAALRNSDARLLEIDGIEITSDGRGMHVWLPRSKTDPFAFGRSIPVSATDDPQTDPVRNVQALLACLPAHGPLFRAIWRNGVFKDAPISKRGIGAIFQRYIQRASDDPDAYGTHSFRAGLVTESKRADIEDAVTMVITGHTSYESLRTYTRFESILEFDINRRIGL